ncbi:hypothetical protein FB45DRAFT_932241 [Roridomyces roridus]|uniref:Uncharacterized protein n=1 Tax=Roridomyces roridus TaxID=1738132 RepID=A0AAD7FGI3_9AGAR|nr:hypothetical protein FB45DRAFT_932241 [Roridomyces roridus]
MATFTTTLLGSLSRIFFVAPSASARPGIPSSQSGPDLASLIPADSPNTRQRARPYSVIEGYWGWADAPRSGMLLRRSRGERDAGLKCLPDTTITQTSPVLISCQPPHGPALCESPPAASSQLTDTVESQDPTVSPTHMTSDVDAATESSFDISLISDTTTAISDELESEADSYQLDDLAPACPSSPPVLAATPARAAPLIGLGITGLFKSDGSPFDGMGVVSFGCSSVARPRPAVTEGGLSRTFLEEAVLTWAADPLHRMASVISEDDATPVDNAVVLAPTKTVLKSKSKVVSVKPTPTRKTTDSEKENRPPTRSTVSPISTVVHRRSNLMIKPKTRDLSAATTISSELKRRGTGSSIQAASMEVTVARQRSASVVPAVRRTSVTAGVWRS